MKDLNFYQQMDTRQSEDSIPINLISQHCFCPRIPYFRETLRIKAHDKPWISQGVSYHKRQSMLSKRRNLDRYFINDKGKMYFDVQLKSDSIPIHGIADMIIVTDSNISVVDFKMSSKKPSKGYVLQVVAYTMIAENYCNRASKNGFILYGERGKTLPIEINKDVKNSVIKVIEEVKKNLESPIMPDSPASEEQCGQCEFVNFCSDRE